MIDLEAPGIETAIETVIETGLETLAAGLAATGFAVVFQVPRRLLFHCAVTGALGRLVRTLLERQASASLPLATLVGAVAVGVAAQAFSGRTKAPTVLFAVSGVIPMLPGVLGFRSLLALFALLSASNEAAMGDLVTFASLSAKATFVVLAIVLGYSAVRLRVS